MRLRIKRVHPDAVIPEYAYPGDACVDLYAADITHGVNITTYDIGIALEIPPGYVGLVFPRSSIYKTGEMFTNAVGVIDSGYRGSISVKTVEGSHTDGDSIIYRKGDRVAQLMLMPVPFVKVEVVDELTPTVRGEQGYGSSGT